MANTARRRAYLGSQGRNLQVSIDALAVQNLNHAVSYLSESLNLDLTTSAVIRFLVNSELAELVRVLPDLGAPDRADLTSRIQTAMKCQPSKLEEATP